MDALTCSEKQLRQGFLNHPALIEFSSLSQEWQQMLINKFGKAPENIKKRYFATQYEYDVEAYRFYNSHTEGIERRNLEPDQVMEYTYNASVLKTVRRVYENRVAYRRMLGHSKKSDIWQILSQEVNHFNEVPHTLPVSPDGLRKKLAKFEKTGFASLIDGRLQNKNAQKVDEHVVKFLNDLFAGQNFKPTQTAIAEMYDAFINGYLEVLNTSTGEIYKPEGFPKLSESTIKSYLARWENTIATHQIRGGDRQININRFTPHHQMELPKFAGSLLSIDDRQPPFAYNKDKDRVWFYIGVDVASRCITAFVHGKSKTGIILDFYRQLVRNYTEWGLPLPYELECESSLNSSFKQSFLKEGAMFQKVRIEANNARGKYIERVFGKLRYEVEKSAIGWIARPKAKSEKNQAGNHPVPILDYADIVNERLKEIMDWNNSPHPEHPEMTCFDYFLDCQHPDIPATNWKDILPHIGHHEESSCNVGKIILQNKKRYIGENGEVLTGETLIAKMKRIEGKKVDIYWLDANDGSVLKAVVFLNGEYICELVHLSYQRATLERTDSDQDIRAIQSSYTATVEAFAKLQKRSIDKVVVIDNRPKTLNRRFQIPGLSRFEPRNTPADELPDNEPAEYAYNETPSGTGSARSFKDTFKI